MSEELELTRSQIRQRMAEAPEVDAEDLRDWIERYLGSGMVGVTMMGRAYAIHDPKEREAMAESMTDLFEKVYRYRYAIDSEERDSDAR